MDPRRRVDWVRGEQQHLPRAADRAGCDVVHSLASTAPLARPRGARDHDPRPQLPARARHPLRPPRARHAAARPRRRAPLAPRDRDLASRPAATSSSTSGAGRRRSTSSRRASRRPAAATPESELRARSASASGPVVLSASAKRPHKNLARLIDALAGIPPERRPLLVVPGYPTPYEAELREHAAPRGVADDVVWPALARRRRPRGPLRARDARRVPVALRGLRAAGAGGDGARRAGRLLGPLLAARGRGRRGAAVRPRGHAARSAPRSSACSPTRRCAPTSRSAGAARAAAFTWERTARADRRRLRARAVPARVDRRHLAQRVLQRQPLRVGGEPGAGPLAQRAAAVVHAHDRARQARPAPRSPRRRR